jgi:betaine reductase
VGATRIVNGGHFTSPSGNPNLPLDREVAFRRSIVEAALRALTDPIEEQRIYEISEEYHE